MRCEREVKSFRIWLGSGRAEQEVVVAFREVTLIVLVLSASVG